MLKDESSRKKFVDDSVSFLQKFEFDGLDLDFECKCFYTFSNNNIFKNN
jgi:GH18 family chitinase